MKRTKARKQAIGSITTGCNGIVQREDDICKVDKTNGLHFGHQILQMLIKGFAISVFEYDIRSDRLFLVQPDEQGQCAQTVVNNFREFVKQPQNLAVIGPVPVRVLLQSKHLSEKMDTIEFQTTTGSGIQCYRAVYQNVEDISEGTTAVIGYSELLGLGGDAADDVAEERSCDPLTKLYNKETTETLVDEGLQSLRRGEKGVLFSFNIDDFKTINERFGNVFGDGCLRSIASMIHADFRYVDILGRVGGDEFAIFIKGVVSIDIVERRAQQILDIFLRIQLPDSGSLSCSVGIAVTSSNSMTYEKLATNAGKALREAKAKGSRCYRMYEG